MPAVVVTVACAVIEATRVPDAAPVQAVTIVPVPSLFAFAAET
jgi:hypothetical protein